MITPITYPARPVNGGPLEKALPKTGRWVAEPKYNGWRALVHVPSGTMFNRKGEQLSIASEFKPALAALEARVALEWVDAEALERRHGIGRGTLIVLDVPEPEHANASYEERRSWLGATLSLPVAPLDKVLENDAVYLTPAWIWGHTGDWFGYPAHDELVRYNTLRAINSQLGCEFYEGIVCKRADSLYPIQTTSPGREFPYWVKHRWKF